MPSDPNNYTVGWICAVETEYTAAALFLDETHPSPLITSPNDPNHYTCGTIAGHNVVMAVLPDGEYGVGSAASVVTNMLHSFPNLRIGLMVGIGGGAPTSEIDIRLGDVVVSSPKDGHGGVFHYDLGKTIQGLGFKQTGFLDQPSPAVRSALPGLKRRYRTEGHQIQEKIDSILSLWPRLKRRGFARPSPECDRLFASDIVHPSDPEVQCKETCLQQPSSTIVRQPREADEDDPMIHYGLIASGNQLMKDAILRDKYAKEKGILCFEMEAAGLMNRFPFMIIRGICDYSDSHKNKDWQGYAAMTAAAYAADLLEEIQPRRVEADDRLVVAVEGLSSDVRNVSVSVAQLEASRRSNEIIKWLNAPDASTNYTRARNMHHANTGQWFLESDQFSRWKQGPNSFLWLHGLSGCGKTVLSSTIIHHLTESQLGPVIFFYFDFSDSDKQTFESMLRSLLYQLYRESPEAQNALRILYESHKRGLTLEAMKSTLQSILCKIRNVNIIIDALDESQSLDQLVQWSEDIQDPRSGGLRLLFTSRTQVLKWSHHDQIMSIQSDGVSNDISAYVHARIHSNEFDHWKAQPKVQDQVESALSEKADGMFRWATLQLDALKECYSIPDVESALAKMPRTLNDTYSRMLETIWAGPHGQRVVTILQMLTWSEFGVTLEACNDAIVVNLDKDPVFTAEDRFFDPRKVVTICFGLLTTYYASWNAKNYVRFAHASVADYLRSNEVIQPFKDQLVESVAKFSILQKGLAYTRCLNRSLSNPSLGIERHPGWEFYPLAEWIKYTWMKYGVLLESADEALALLLGFVQMADLPQSAPMFDYLIWFIGIEPEKRCSLYLAARAGFTRVFKQLLEDQLRNSDLETQLGRFGVKSVKNNDTDLQLRSHSNQRRGAIIDLQHEHETIGTILEDLTASNAESLWAGRRAEKNRPKTDKLQLQLDASLVVAAWTGHLEIVQELLAYGVSASAVDVEYSALQAAAFRGHEQVVKVLVEHGAAINFFEEGASLGTALKEATGRCDVTMVKFLLAHEADANMVSGYTSSTPLLEICARDPYENFHDDKSSIAKALIANGADVNLRAGYSSPLAEASKDSIDLVRILVNAGADLEDDDSFSDALASAVTYEQEDIIHFLLEKGEIHRSNECEKTNRTRAMIKPLKIAASAGYSRIVEILLDRGADVNLTDEDEPHADSPLQTAAREGFTKLVQLLLKHGANIDASSDHGCALKQAVKNDRIEVVQMLLDNRANVNGSDGPNQSTPLQEAAYMGLVTTVRLLLEHGAEVEASNSCPSALYNAASRGNDEIVQLLLERKADVDGGEDALWETPLQAAACNGHSDIAQILISHGAKLDAPNDSPSALFHAAVQGHKDIVRLLLAEGADVDGGEDALWETPLQAAAYNGHSDIAQILVRHGAKLDASTHSSSALFHAAVQGHKDTVRLLLAEGADVDGGENALWKTPLQAAARYRHSDIAQILVSHGAKLDTPNGSRSALVHAAGFGDEKLVRLLLEKGAHVDGGEEAAAIRETPLQHAACNGRKTILRILLHRGANPNASGPYACPLYEAVKWTEREIMNLLVARGANIASAIEHAWQRNDRRVVRRLRQLLPPVPDCFIEWQDDNCLHLLDEVTSLPPESSASTAPKQRWHWQGLPGPAIVWSHGCFLRTLDRTQHRVQDVTEDDDDSCELD